MVEKAKIEEFINRLTSRKLTTVIKSCRHLSEPSLFMLVTFLLQGRVCFIESFRTCLHKTYFEVVQGLVELGIDEAIQIRSGQFYKAIAFNWEKLRSIIKEYAISQGATVKSNTFYFPNNDHYVMLMEGAEGPYTHYHCFKNI